MKEYQISGRRVMCPSCGKPIVVKPRSFTISSEAVTEQAEATAEAPKLSRLQEAALAEITELGLQHELRKSVVAARLQEHTTWATASGRATGEKYAFLQSKPFICPYEKCGAQLAILLEPVIVSAIPAVMDDGAPLPVNRPLKGVDKETQEFVDLCRTSGVLAAFEAAFGEQVSMLREEGNASASIPKDIAQTFAAFLRTAVRGFPSNILFQDMRAELANQNMDNNVQYWHSNGVGVITVDDQIYRFMPARLLQSSPRPVRQALQSVVVKKPQRPLDPSRDWVRNGRAGYVPLGSQIHLAELRSRSKGAFPTF